MAGIKYVIGAEADYENAQSILGTIIGYNYQNTTENHEIPSPLTSNMIVLGGSTVTGITNTQLNGALRLFGVNTALTSQAINNYNSPRYVYGAQVDIDNAKEILGSTGHTYIVVASKVDSNTYLTYNDIVLGGSDVTGITDNQLLGAIRLSGEDRFETASAIQNYAISKNVYGVKTDIDNANRILGISGYNYIDTGFSDPISPTLPTFTCNDIILGGIATHVNLNATNGAKGATGLTGATAFDTANLVRALIGLAPLAPDTGGGEGSYEDFLVKLASHESAGGLNNGYGEEGWSHYLGKYQLGEYALNDAGFYNDSNLSNNDYTGTWTDTAKSYNVTSKDTFLNNVSAQEYAIREYHKKTWGYIKNYQQYISKTVRGIRVTASGLIAVAHLVGCNKMAQYFDESQPCPADGNGTLATIYMSDMGGYDLTEILGYNPDGNSTTGGSGNADTDKLISKALVEVGYHEGANNDNKYGQWYGDNHVYWCANEAGILNTAVPKYEGCSAGQDWYQSRNKLKLASSGYITKAGDVVFYGNNGNDHTGIVVAYDPNTQKIWTVEGNYSGSVSVVTTSISSDYIYSYGENGGTTYGQIPNVTPSQRGGSTT